MTQPAPQTAAPTTTEVATTEQPLSLTEVAAVAGGVIGDAPAAEIPPETDPLAHAREVADKLKAKRAARRTADAARIDESRRSAVLESQLIVEREARVRAERSSQAFDVDPVGEMRRRGVPAAEIAKAAIDQNSPEAIARRAELRAERLEQQLYQRDQHAARQAFIGEAVAGFERFPNVAAHAQVRPMAILSEAAQVIAERGGAFHRAHGRPPTNLEVLEFLEYQYEQADQARAGKRPAPETKETKPAEVKPAAPAPASGARTLTGKVAERAQVPVNFDDLTPEQQLPYLAKQLRERTSA